MTQPVGPHGPYGAETKAFPANFVLTVVTGRSLIPQGIGGVYEVLNWMTGESLYTHQLPRVCHEALPHILALHPDLQTAIDEAEQVNGDTWKHWLDVWTDRYGPEITVPKLTLDQHERIDPVSELAEKVHPDKIIVLEVKP